MGRLQDTNSYPFTLFGKDASNDKPTMWLQNGRDIGHGPSGHFAEEGRRIYIDFGRGKWYDPLCNAFLDLMERDLGGHPDRNYPMGFRWIISNDGKSSYITGGNVFVIGKSFSGETESVGLQIDMPNFMSIGLTVFGRTLILSIRTSQKFKWEILDDQGFERLMYRLYFELDFDNIQWLQKTRAADIGRDISATRTSNGNRVLIQARHQTSSITALDVNNVVVKAETWSPPFQEVIIVTTSTFTQEAIRWTERHNSNPGNRPTVVLEPGGHLEVMLSKHPFLISHIGLR